MKINLLEFNYLIAVRNFTFYRMKSNISSINQSIMKKTCKIVVNKIQSPVKEI